MLAVTGRAARLLAVTRRSSARRLAVARRRAGRLAVTRLLRGLAVATRLLRGLAIRLRGLTVARLLRGLAVATRLLRGLSITRLTTLRRLTVASLLRGLTVARLLRLTVARLLRLAVTRLLRLTIATLLRGLLSRITGRVTGGVIATRGLVHARYLTRPSRYGSPFVEVTRRRRKIVKNQDKNEAYRASATGQERPARGADTSLVGSPYVFSTNRGVLDSVASCNGSKCTRRVQSARNCMHFTPFVRQRVETLVRCKLPARASAHQPHCSPLF
ncbi:hypothetical protein AKJ09_11322 [Labilithrix luteola]|uniref:Uncharacterized protein n=1 Tax=Labilithrix luteola TaxID=1391654 RepID=A0A0K1QFW8_9BACT|nr:hypothetical protein AKJ09_11322 [Labilithrix luteola]